MRLAGAASRASCAVDSFIPALVALRRAAPFTALEQTRNLPCADEAVLALGTVEGPGTVNVNAAPASVLLALPGLGAEAVERITARRAVGRPIGSLDELAGELSPSARAALLERYADLARLVTFSAPQLLVTARGWIEGRGGPDGLHVAIELLVVPLPERLAVIRRRMW